MRGCLVKVIFKLECSCDRFSRCFIVELSAELRWNVETAWAKWSYVDACDLQKLGKVLPLMIYSKWQLEHFFNMGFNKELNTTYFLEFRSSRYANSMKSSRIA